MKLLDTNNPNANSANQFSVAPMLDWTDRHCRYFHRQLTQGAWLYSEMVTTGALIYGNNLPRFLGFNAIENPVVLQLGGSDPQEMAKCAKLGEEWGYSEININVGCPSDRVQNNMIGACLFKHPQLVADNVAEMKQHINIPVTVKTRIGVDDHESFEGLMAFLESIQAAGVDGVILHARKAWLQGLSPKENRDVPPLNYDWVYQAKQLLPDLSIAINGGITEHAQAIQQLDNDNFNDKSKSPVDGVMIGRAAYEQPYMLSEVDHLYYGAQKEIISRESVVQNMLPYIDNHLANGGKLIQVTRHMLGLFHGLPGGRMWRRYLSQNAFKKEAGTDTVLEALKIVSDEIDRMEEQNLRRLNPIQDSIKNVGTEGSATNSLNEKL